MNQTLRHTLQRYLGGREEPGSLALLRPFLVAACLEEGLLPFMLTLHARGDQPVLLQRLKRYTSIREPEIYRRFESATAPLFSQPTLQP